MIELTLLLAKGVVMGIGSFGGRAALQRIFKRRR